MTKTVSPSVVASAPAYTIDLEKTAHAHAIASLHDEAFGPGRYVRAAFRLREQGPHDNDLSFVALDENGQLMGSVRLTWICASESKHKGLLLGPLAVNTAARDKGIGRALVAHCVKAAATARAGYLLLVGDQPYYDPLGFEVVPNKSLSLPGPVDLNRLLVCPLNGFDPSALEGTVTHVNMVGG